MQIRPAHVQDARGIAEIHVHTWQAAYPGIVPAGYLASLSVEKYEKMWHECVVKGNPHLLVATEHGRMVGPSRDQGINADVAEIWAIYVGASHCGRGVGRQLWQQTHTCLREQGFKSVGLWAFPENVRAGKFYRALGFELEPSSGKQFTLGGSQLNGVRYVRPIDA